MDQLLGMVPYLSQNLGLPEYIFQGIRENAEKFDFDNNGMLDEHEVKRMLKALLIDKMIELGGGMESPPEKTPEEAGYKIVKEIGRGAFGVMYLCEKGGVSSPAVCAKKVGKGHLSPYDAELVLSEFATMRRFHHKNVAQTYEIFQDQGAYYIIQLPAASPATAPAQRFGWRLFE